MFEQYLSYNNNIKLFKNYNKVQTFLANPTAENIEVVCTQCCHHLATEIWNFQEIKILESLANPWLDLEQGR